MAFRSRLNAEYVQDVVWELRLTLNQLNERAGYSGGYIYRLLNPESAASVNAANVKLETIDALANAIAMRMLELGKETPPDLWCKLTVQDDVADAPTPKAVAPGGAKPQLAQVALMPV